MNTTAPRAHPPIPYGRANFRSLRRDGCLYVDKTRFIRQLEKERYVFLVRPRRFGKTLWLTMLDAYYDRAQARDFASVFAGTDIGRAPTPNRSRYVVLYFNFSVIRQRPATLEESFERYCALHVRDALRRNRDLFDDEAMREILEPRHINEKLEALFLHVRQHDIPLYVLIDEYDNFANNIIVGEGPDAYERLTRGGGFYRDFFATLKGGTDQTGSVERLFVTGVSPITMDDVTSGFNIGTNLSLRGEFNDMLGFTENEVKGLLETYGSALGQDADAALATMREWYDGYRFAVASSSDVHNTDMVLHYLRESIAGRRSPEQLIDDNIRIDYGKLRHLLTVAGKQRAERAGAAAQPNGNFDLLRHLIAEERAHSQIRSSFPLRRLGERENFLSLLHFFGLLSIRGAVDGAPRLAVPNQTVKQLMFGYLRDAYEDAGLFKADFYVLERLLREMAYRGAWQPVFEHLGEAVARQTGIRDYIAGEKVLQGFLAAYLGVTDHFLFYPERELNKGYADICLAPNLASHPDMRHGYIVELKYLKPREGGERRIAAALDRAKAQLRQYLADETLGRRYPTVRFIGVALVFRGSELARCVAL